jgi:hypothetical protein
MNAPTSTASRLNDRLLIQVGSRECSLNESRPDSADQPPP